MNTKRCGSPATRAVNNRTKEDLRVGHEHRSDISLSLRFEMTLFCRIVPACAPRSIHSSNVVNTRYRLVCYWSPHPLVQISKPQRSHHEPRCPNYLPHALPTAILSMSSLTPPPLLKNRERNKPRNKLRPPTTALTMSSHRAPPLLRKLQGNRPRKSGPSRIRLTSC
jgi:hypothetical protein